MSGVNRVRNRLGFDIIREVQSGKLYVLEANPGGNTWIFSKGDMTAQLKVALGAEQLTDQLTLSGQRQEC
jgi:hypothetical protein